MHLLNFIKSPLGWRARLSYAFCVNAILSALLFCRNTFRNHHAVKNGVKIAVTMTDAATWTVAAAATGAYDGSAIATACGTAAELPALLEAADLEQVRKKMC